VNRDNSIVNNAALKTRAVSKVVAVADLGDDEDDL